MIDHLSSRGRSFVKDLSPLIQAHFKSQGDPYDFDSNHGGYINMGTAETHLINEEIIDLLYKVQNRLQLNPEHIHYDHFYGSKVFRNAIAEYWQTLIFGRNSIPMLNSNRIVVGAGCSLALEMLATMLGDPGDVFLIPAPYYPGFVNDIFDRAKIIPIGVYCGSDLSREAFESAYIQQIRQGRKVKAVLFSSPNNPIGTVYTVEAIKELINFCIKKEIHLISDEIYAQTIHDPEVTFVSALKLVPKCYLSYVHVTSGFAKDFALSGFRVGFVISFNENLLKGLKNLSYYSAVSTHTQVVLTELLNAPELSKVMQKSREQLRSAYLLIYDYLKEMEVEILPAQGGIFLLANLKKYMEKQDFKSEFSLWEKIYQELKVNISPGRLFKVLEPGWFRICYAHDPIIVKEACKRLHSLRKNCL